MKTKLRTDLGIAIAHSTFRRRLTHKEIAAYADCTWQNIWLDEQRALHKLRRAAYLRNDAVLIALKQNKL